MVQLFYTLNKHMWLTDIPVTKLLELHGETGGGDVGTKIPKTEFVEKIRAVV